MRKLTEVRKLEMLGGQKKSDLEEGIHKTRSIY
jgi:hypothetical protein